MARPGLAEITNAALQSKMDILLTIVDGLGNVTTEVKQPVRLDTSVAAGQTVSFGYFLRNGNSWDFYGYDGSIVHGSGTL